MTELDDATLVGLAIAELPYVTSAYEVLAKRYYALIYRTCLGMLRNVNDAEDATQAILLKVFNGLGRFEQRASFKTWLLRIVTNTCITLAKKRQREIVFNEPLIEDDAIAQEVAKMPDVDIPFDDMIDTLDEIERNILTLRFVGESSLSEIADITGMGLSAIKMRYYRALEKLKVRHS